MQDSLKPRHRSALVEYLARGMGKKSWKRGEKNAARKLKCPLKALFLVLLNECTVLDAEIQCVNMHMGLFFQQNLTNSP